MITKEDLKHEIEQLDDGYLNLVFRLLQQFPHQKNNSDLLTCSRPINYSEAEISDGTVLTDIENIAQKNLPTQAREILQQAWGCIEKLRSIEQIDADIAQMRSEWE